MPLLKEKAIGWGIDKDKNNRSVVFVGKLVGGLQELYMEVNAPDYEAGETPNKDDIEKDIVNLEPVSDLVGDFRYWRLHRPSGCGA